MPSSIACWNFAPLRQPNWAELSAVQGKCKGKGWRTVGREAKERRRGREFRDRQQ